MALILTGGGSLGAIQVGMLGALVSNGFRPDLVVGVSAGALNGAFFAEDPCIATVDRMAALWARVRTREVLGLSWRSLLALAGLRGHIADPRGLRAVLDAHLAARDFAALRIPLYVIGAEIVSGSGRVLSSGGVQDAILASTAIPGVFPPVAIHGELLVDGAIAHESPIAVAVRLGATRLVVLPCGFPCAGAAVSGHALGRAMHAITLLGCRQLRQDYGLYSSRADICVVPPLCPLGLSAYDYSRGSDLIGRARSATQAWLMSGGLGRSEFPGALLPHQH